MEFQKEETEHLMEMVRCMLHEKDLPKKFWAEAANKTVFLQNRLPTKALQDKTSFEAWYGFKPSLSFLKIFGCVCFVMCHMLNELNETSLTRKQFLESLWAIIQSLKPTKCIRYAQIYGLF